MVTAAKPTSQKNLDTIQTAASLFGESYDPLVAISEQMGAMRIRWEKQAADWRPIPPDKLEKTKVDSVLKSGAQTCHRFYQASFTASEATVKLQQAVEAGKGPVDALKESYPTEEEVSKMLTQMQNVNNAITTHLPKALKAFDIVAKFGAPNKDEWGAWGSYLTGQIPYATAVLNLYPLDPSPTESTDSQQEEDGLATPGAPTPGSAAFSSSSSSPSSSAPAKPTWASVARRNSTEKKS